MKRCLPFLSFMKNCPENFGRQWGSKHELVQRVYNRLASIFFSLFRCGGGGGGGGGVTGGVCDSASARTRSRDILFELTL